ncbi:MAG TPA: quinone-dependent dihydroorotate dehydrogenase [Arachidicoccus soli]|uniref:Dihydroorotate dehydrogenase (quinone) n=1 Tax=Arachidicoccus soli TaxID=2341117 RepID=A0A386HMN8_9BACT|nr:quinone-dependent dihydroorotate dehydrogenase [Arachidicoccus soli]AYD46942.1 quinone-dependent dihydroorotate dehydrogenase [Arachidicoccus soli]HEU0228318.1 quinone-dependent dihydroorotate dehydrogenase [Arachidicoccus soli]
MIYPLLRNLLFKLSPEKAHHVSMDLLQKACSVSASRKLIQSTFSFQHPSLQRNVFGLNFQNPIGLGAGFDKNAVYLREIAALGFGFLEVGTVTPRAQSGNELPRLFRLPKDKALINRMGFNNDGVDVLKKRLSDWNTSFNRPKEFIIGGNIGKNKITLNENAWKDYMICFRELFEVVDYFTVNVSSPNTPGLRELQGKESLKKIFSELQNINHGKKKPKPILLKIAPDLTQEQLNDIIFLSLEIKLSGLIATNTTIERTDLLTDSSEIERIGAGGLSGLPVKHRSTEVVKYLCKELNNQIPVVASGGVFTAKDTKEKLNAGASLVQVWTGFIYEGPGIASKICKSLAKG